MINVGVVFGGKSAEHEVSIKSAFNVVNSLNRNEFVPFFIFIDKSGKWFLVEEDDFFKKRFVGDEVVFLNGGGGDLFNMNSGEVCCSLDIVFPVLHGPNGEDGVVQGVFRNASVPFVGFDVLGSAVSMDKDVMKRLFRDACIPIGDFFVVRSDEELMSFDVVVEKVGLPFFVKPANMGSSVGVHKVYDEEGYFTAIKDAFLFDSKVVVERFIDGREVECSVLEKRDGEVVSSVVGEIVLNSDFYSYESKYLNSNESSLVIPAVLDDEVIEEIRELAVKVFKVVCGRGLGRVDFFVEKSSGKVFVNEINSLPGFTDISMFPKLFEVSGISNEELVSELIFGGLR